MRRFICWCTGIVGLVAIDLGAVHAEEITIGLTAPGTGPYGASGLQLKHGAEMAVADLNSGGGVLGRPVRLEEVEDACDSSTAIRTALDLIDRKKAVFVAGPFCLRSSIAESPIYAAKDILQITLAAYSPEVTKATASHVVATLFRVLEGDDQRAVLAAGWLAKNYPHKDVAIIHDATGIANDIAGDLRARIQTTDVKVVLNEAISTEQTSFSNIVSKLQSAHPDVVLLSGSAGTLAALVLEARKQLHNVPMVSITSLASDNFVKAAGTAADGVKFIDVMYGLDIPAAKNVLDAFHNDGFDADIYALDAYAAVQAWAAGARRANAFDGPTVAKALRDKGADTILGHLSWDSRGDLTWFALDWYEVRNGKAVFCPTCSGEDTTCSGNEHHCKIQPPNCGATCSTRN